jgi:chemotaxis protein CheX
MLALHTNVSDLLDSIMSSVKQVVPLPIAFEEPDMWEETVLKSEMCVLVGITGETQGRMIIDSSPETFGKLGEAMFGMALKGEMLHSFVGEAANMVAGNMCTFASQKGQKVDITPPTIVVGEMKLFGFRKAFSVSVSIRDVGAMNIVLLINEEKQA